MSIKIFINRYCPYLAIFVIFEPVIIAVDCLCLGLDYLGVLEFGEDFFYVLVDGGV